MREGFNAYFAIYYIHSTYVMVQHVHLMEIPALLPLSYTELVVLFFLSPSWKSGFSHQLHFLLDSLLSSCKLVLTTTVLVISLTSYFPIINEVLLSSLNILVLNTLFFKSNFLKNYFILLF